MRFSKYTKEYQKEHSMYFYPIEELCCAGLTIRFASGDMWMTKHMKMHHTADTRHGHHIDSCPYCGAAIEIEIVEAQS